MLERFFPAAAVIVALLAAMPAHAQSQNYPNRIIKFSRASRRAATSTSSPGSSAHRDGEEPRPVDRGRGQARRSPAPCRRDASRAATRRLHAAGGAERASGLWRAVEERQVQGGRRFHLDFGRELLSVHDLREGGFALQDAQATDRRGARQARRTEIRLGRRRLDPAHHGRADGQPDQDQVPARALSRRGAGDHRPAARRRRFHRGHHGADQRAHQVRRIPRARGDRQDALARFPRCADGREAGASRDSR